MKEEKFDLDDIQIAPAVLSNINSREDINNRYGDYNFLPIFAAPMDTVVSYQNYNHFLSNKINVCLPRNQYVQTHEKGSVFHSLSLSQFENFFIKKEPSNIFIPGELEVDYENGLFESFNYVLIDMANGHMERLYDSIKKVKEEYGNKINIMCGNIAHPQTYLKLSEAGADYVRLSIGTGNGCLIAISY